MQRYEGRVKLTENARTVLEKRYLKKDEQGLPLEKPEDMFRRVANNIAQADRYYDRHADVRKTEDEFYSLMAEFEFLPNSPTLMNAGRDLQQLSACFTKEQKILSNPGYKNIDQIKIGDKVITHEGRIKKVLEVHQRKYIGKVYKVNVRGVIKPTLNVTGEHPILSIKKEDLVCKRMKDNKCNGFIKRHCLKTPMKYRKDCELVGQLFKPRWIPVKELKEKDFVVVSTNKEVKDVSEIKLKDYLNDDIYLVKGDYLVARGRPNEGKEIPNKIEIDNDFLRLIGYWLADGSLSKRYDKYAVIRFTFNLKEKKFCKEVKRIMKEKFSLSAKEEFTDKQKTIQLRFNSIIVAELFYKLFGKGFNGKRLPAWIITLPQEKQFNLLVGLFRGDGCYSKIIGSKQDLIFVSLSNEKLATDIWNILLRLGYNFNINYRKPKGGTKEAYRISASPSECKGLVLGINKGQYRQRNMFPQYIKTGNLTLRSIDKIESNTFEGDVYNLEVEDDHSYLANGVAVHNCFVLPLEDSMEGIFETLKSTALIHKSGGGTGYSFSRLRPKGSQVKSTSGIASGPISFLKVFDAATQAVKQGGTRRGANMGILRVDHPDILEFITCKEDDKTITNFNISVAVTDEFMRKVIAQEEYDLIDPHNGKPAGKLNAKEVFELIIKQAHKNGEPGIIFIDRMNRDNPTPKIGEIESTNPCGEQPLLPYESCNLASINLAKMLVDKNEKYEIDWVKFARVISKGVHFLDNVIDMNRYPIKRIEQMTRSNRKIGLGVMGFADMLIALGIPYNSDEAVALAEKIMKFILDEASKASVDLAKKRNSFPNFKDSIYSNGAQLRNATLTTIAPTGTLSIIASCSSGIEPIFSICYYRKVLDGAKLMEVNPYFENTAKEKGFYSEELMKKISQQSSISNMQEIPEDIRRVFVTSHDISPLWHIKMQAAFQKYTNNAVSKTVNFPYQATPEEVKEVYTLAYKLGCKGVTIYRDGSRTEQVLNIDRGERTTEKQIEVKQGTSKIAPRPRPKVVCGTTTKVQTGCGNLYVTINQDESGKPFEVFTQMGKAGGCAASQLEALGRLVSLALRSDIDIKSIIDQLEGIRCPSPSWEKGGRIFSCADAIGKVIERELLHKKQLPARDTERADFKPNDGLGKDSNGKGDDLAGPQYYGGVSVKSKVNDVVGVCPDCGGALHYQEGCMICHGCAFTKCG